MQPWTSSARQESHHSEREEEEGDLSLRAQRNAWRKTPSLVSCCTALPSLACLCYVENQYSFFSLNVIFIYATPQLS